VTVYNTIKGLKVKYLSGDPANPEVGQVWYNSTTGNLRVDGIAGTGAWASGGAVNTNRASLAGAGTQNDMIINGGNSPAFESTTAAETYNGTSWTAITASPTATKQMASTGTTTSAANFIGGGPDPKKNITQHWNGSSWSAGGTLATARANMRGTGPHTAGIILGGQGASGAGLLAEKYNGTSWTSASTLAAGNFGGSMAGTSTAAIGFGGYYDLRPSGGSEAQTAQTFSYDGSTWSIVNSMANVRNYGQGAGSSGSAIVGGKSSAPASTLAEQWDGTSWTAAAAMAIGRWSGGSAGTSAAAATVVAGLSGGSYVGTSEEYTIPSGTQSITTS
tara:strand:- start:102 stop:1100 length:999 start_codon:yes stop_codon:yes gene_type:complete